MKRFLTIFLIILSALTLHANSSEKIALLENVSCSNLPSVSLDQVYSSLDHGEKVFLAESIKKQLIAMLPPDFLDKASSYLDQAGKPEYKKYLESAIAFLKSTNPEAAVAFLDKVDKKKPIVVNPALFKLYHDYAFSHYRGQDVESVPAFLKDGIGTVSGLEISDNPPVQNVPKTSFNSKYESNGRSIGTLDEVIGFKDSVLANSMALAQVLNQLSNYGTSGTYSEIIMTIDGRRSTLQTPEDLVSAIYKSQNLEITGFEARMGVDFLGYCVSQGGSYCQVEIPTVMTTALSGSFSQPSNHAEHLLAIYKKGGTEPLALVKWYMGIPMDNTLHQGTIWKPAIHAHSSWCGFKITHVYNKLQSLITMVEGARYLMKAFNSIQMAAHYPMNGYAVLAVCCDSTSILETVLKSDPDFTPWPNTRSLKYDGFYQQVLSRFGNGLSLIGDNLNTPSDSYPEIYYGNSISTNYLKRLVLNLPFRSKESISGGVFGPTYDQLFKLSHSFNEDLNRVFTD
ncbi:MAG: hypothetical protein PHW04_00245 [Candidatus Wallbacteria bacterium]|nr:hypothetical protein [Candidatus Wallbacteria bacterium]